MVQTYPAQLAEFWNALSIESNSIDLQVSQQISRTAAGEVITAELGASLWRGSVSLQPLLFGPANKQLSLIRLMARPGASFLVSPVIGRRPADSASASLLDLNSVRSFDDGIGAWTAGTLSTDLPRRPPAAITTALNHVDRTLFDGATRTTMSGLASRVFRITGWVRNNTNAFDLQVGIERENGSGTVGNTVTTVATAGVGGWVYVDTTVTAPADAVKWRPMVLSNGTAGDPGHDFWIADLVWQSWTINALSADLKELKIEEMPAAVFLSAGDYLSFEYGSAPVRYGFHQLVEDAETYSIGISPWFEVVPPMRTGVSTGMQVNLLDPVVKAVIVPGSIKQGREARHRRSGIAFDWIQTLR